MTLYCITYIQKMDRKEIQKTFFVYAENKEKAIKRFVETSGNKKSDILKIREVTNGYS